MNGNNANFLMGKGKEFSAVAAESEAQLRNWLNASGITEQELLETLDSGEFQLTLNKEKNKAIIYVHQGTSLITEPLVWLKESGVLLGHFKVDAGLLLMLVASKCENKHAKEKIKKFVKVNLRVK